ncbi:MAG: hypothetical protein U5N58_15430 [Actinomycetota bacterium]|nr:hypothetical protein [Actinomycetota bacterium]
MTDHFVPGLAVELGDLKLKNPVVTCSGTFGSGIEYSNFYDLSILGAVTTKSFSLLSRQGNPPPRIFETAGGILNSIGLQNPGIDQFITDDLPSDKKLKYQCHIKHIWLKPLKNLNRLLTGSWM